MYKGRVRPRASRAGPRRGFFRRPRGFIDDPRRGSARVRGPLYVRGWALFPGSTVARVEVRLRGGPPQLRLSGAAAERASELGANVAVSLTHTRGMAGAVALVRHFSHRDELARAAAVPPSPAASAEQVLADRFARGEIDEAEFVRRRNALRS